VAVGGCFELHLGKLTGWLRKSGRPLFLETLLYQRGEVPAGCVSPGYGIGGVGACPKGGFWDDHGDARDTKKKTSE